MISFTAHIFSVITFHDKQKTERRSLYSHSPSLSLSPRRFLRAFLRTLKCSLYLSHFIQPKYHFVRSNAHHFLVLTVLNLFVFSFILLLLFVLFLFHLNNELVEEFLRKSRSNTRDICFARKTKKKTKSQFVKKSLKSERKGALKKRAYKIQIFFGFFQLATPIICNTSILTLFNSK